jgi:hypothetical protein
VPVHKCCVCVPVCSQGYATPVTLAKTILK